MALNIVFFYFFFFFKHSHVKNDNVKHSSSSSGLVKGITDLPFFRAQNYILFLYFIFFSLFPAG